MTHECSPVPCVQCKTPVTNVCYCYQPQNAICDSHMWEPTVDSWLTRFAAGAGTLFEWHLEDNCMIRAAIGDKNLCPLAAQATLEEGTIYVSEVPSLAALAQNLPYNAWFAIVETADRNIYGDKEVRKRLLNICNLQEESEGE